MAAKSNETCFQILWRQRGPSWPMRCISAPCVCACVLPLGLCTILLKALRHTGTFGAKHPAAMYHTLQAPCSRCNGLLFVTVLLADALQRSSLPTAPSSAHKIQNHFVRGLPVHRFLWSTTASYRAQGTCTLQARCLHCTACCS